MPKDVIVVVNLDAKPNPSEALDILILSTAGAKDPAIYRSIEEVAEDYPNSGDTAKIYRKVSAQFEQGKTTLADTLIRKVKIAGVAPPTGQDDGEKAEALITAIETLRQTDDDWYMLLTDQDGDDYVKALCASAEGTASKTTANSTSARLTTSLWPSRTACEILSTPTPRTSMRRRTPPTSATSAPSTPRA